MFDLLVQLSEQGDIDMEYHYDIDMDTHVIDSINGEPNWWYKVKYPGGWYETNVFRMDMYPYKDGTSIHIKRHPPQYLAAIYRTS